MTDSNVSTNSELYPRRLGLFVILIMIVSLGSARILHRQQTIEQQNLAYYASLSQQQRDVKVQLTNLKKEIQYLNQTLSQVQALPSMKTVALQQALADERDTLYSVQQTLSIPFQMKTVQCRNQSKKERKDIEQLIRKVQNETDRLKVLIEGLPDLQGCQLCEELKKEYQWDLLYLDRAKRSLEPCPTLKPSEFDLLKLTNLSKYTKVSNLNSKDANWVYGNTTETDYYVRQFNRNQDRNVSKCPPETPFVKSGEKDCSECPRQAPVFNIQTQTCIRCVKGKQYNSTSHQCQEPKPEPPINGTVTTPIKPSCASGQTYNRTTDTCTCPPSKPYFTGSNCIPCLLPRFFNQTSKKCQSCPQNQHYDPVSQRCTSCKGGKEYDLKKGKCQCPQTKPFEGKNRECTACYLPKYWNLDNKRCEFCQNGKYYDVNIRKCVQCPENQPISVEGKCKKCPVGTQYNPEENKCQGQSLTCQSNYIYNKIKKVCECPSESPFDIGSDCKSCFLPQYWSPTQQKCLSCPDDQFYNFHSGNCQYCPPQKPQIIGSTCSECQTGKIYDAGLEGCIKRKGEFMDCPQGYLYNSEEEGCVCPKNKPFDNGDECVSCYLPRYWDYQSKKCQECDLNTEFDQDRGKCVKCPEKRPVTDRDGNCIACEKGTVFKEEEKQCIKIDEYCEDTYIIDKETGDCVCPKQAPFDNGQKCVTCYLPSYWDEDEKSCSSCPKNHFYNSKAMRCEACPKDTPIFKTYKCEECPQKTMFLPSKQECVKFDEYCAAKSNEDRKLVYDQSSRQCVCPKKTPFDNGQKCVSCFLPKYWNHDKKQCLHCPQNLYYDTNLLKCTSCPASKPLLSANLSSCQPCPQNTAYSSKYRSCVQQSTQCSSNYEYDPQSRKCICPVKFPFDNGSKCVACYLPKYWSHDRKECLSCQANYYYDTSLKKCKKCQDDKPYLPKGAMNCQQCPRDQPFFDGEKCRQCPDGLKYNAEKKQCVKRV